MRKLAILSTMVLLSLSCLALAQQQKSAPEQQANSAGDGSAVPVNPSRVAQAAPFTIGPEDILDVSVWKEPNVSRTVPVRPDGMISLPLVKDLQAEGLSPMQLAAAITEKLKKFLNDPQVTVTVTAINSQKVYVVGEVNRPGPISLLTRMTALQAISSAGGVTQYAKQTRGYVLRNEGGKDLYYPLNYRDLLRGDMRGNIVLKSGDTVVVP